MRHVEKITICGGGNGAQTLASVASSNLACDVDIYAPFGDEAERLRAGIATQGGIEIWGAVRGTGRPRRVSGDAAEVVPGSDVVLLVLPAFAHESTLAEVVRFLDRGAWVGAAPARGGLDYCAARVLEEAGRPDVTVFGLQTLPWACRIREYGRVVDVLGVKRSVDVASRPAAEVGLIAALLEQMLGLPVGMAGSILALTLANTGQIIHPGIMYDLFSDWDGVPFGAEEIPLFYQGLSEEGSRVLGDLSLEIESIGGRLTGLGLDVSGVRPLKTWLLRCYGHVIGDASSLRSAFVTNQAYAGLKAPTREVAAGQFVPDLRGRYLAEDVPFGLSVSQAIARLAGVETRVMDRVAAWAQGQLSKQTERIDLSARTPQAYGVGSLQELIAFTVDAAAGT
ncbi:MAG: NAD/NADP octopine/nopaline dehydrogenase family protein [Anaerolineae bacterium]